MKGKAEKNEKKQGPAPAKEQSLSNENAAVFQDQRPSLAVQRKLRGGMGDPPQQRGTAQLRSAMQSTSGASSFPIQRKANRTGLPNNLKSGIENLSGFAMDDVKVHYNSSKPAQLQAHAYAQGSNIHLGPGQEKHLAHEAWHVVQQKQGRVKPTRQLKSKVAINDDAGLEKEADVMGEKAMQFKGLHAGTGNGLRLHSNSMEAAPLQKKEIASSREVVQRHKKVSEGAKVGIEIETTLPVRNAVEITPEMKGAHEELLEMIKKLNDYKKDSKDYKKLKKQIKKKRAVISKQLDPRYKTMVHKGNRWKAVVDHVPRVRKLFERGDVPIDSAVEIVTDPVTTEGEAKDIMAEIYAWIKTVLGNIHDEGRHHERLTNTVKGIEAERDYLFEMPPQKEEEEIDEKTGKKRKQIKLLEAGQLIGNIQVNVGAKLEDVRDVFLGNKKSLPGNHKYLVDRLAGDELWNKVKKKFNSNLLRQDIQKADEEYLRSIMFLYLYNSASAVISENDQTEKNKYPILGKTPIGTQIGLSNWKKMDKWLTANEGMFNMRIWDFKKRFHDAIMDALNIETFAQDFFLDQEKVENFRSYMGMMKTTEEPKKIGDLSFIDEKKQLRLDKAKDSDRDEYAGVFELRGFQDSDVLADQWENVWLSFFNPDINNPLLQKSARKLEGIGGGDNKDKMKRINPNIFLNAAQGLKKTKKEEKPENHEI